MKNILAKLHDIQAEVEKMGKDGRNTFQNYNYLSETQVTIKIKELLDKHNVMFLPKEITEKQVTEISPTSKGTKQYVTTVTVKYAFADVETGEMYEGSIEGQGSDTADKGIYKAITGAIKYVYMKTFNIPTGDDPERTEKKTFQYQNGTVSSPVVKNQPQYTPDPIMDATATFEKGAEAYKRLKEIDSNRLCDKCHAPQGKPHIKGCPNA
jgi:hypothetical protein